MSQHTERRVVTAFFTEDGAAAYLNQAGTWSRSLQEARPLAPEESERLVAERAATDQRTVCDPYAFKVEVRGDAIDPLTTRERIRATGPTTRLRRPD